MKPIPRMLEKHSRAAARLQRRQLGPTSLTLRAPRSEPGQEPSNGHVFQACAVALLRLGFSGSGNLVALKVASIWSSGPTAHIGNDNLGFGDKSFGLLGDLELLGDRLEFVERRRTVSCEDFRSTSWCHRGQTSQRSSSDVDSDGHFEDLLPPDSSVSSTVQSL